MDSINTYWCRIISPSQFQKLRCFCLSDYTYQPLFLLTSFLLPINGGKTGWEDEEESATAGLHKTIGNCPLMHVVNEHEFPALLHQKRSLNIMKFSRVLPIRSEINKKRRELYER